jgi:hypothetical protein
MNQTELFINGKRMELDEKSLVAMSYVQNDIAQVTDVNSDFSQIFNVPKSPGNIKNMEWADLTSSDSAIAYRTAIAHLIQGGVTTVPLAIAQLTGADDDYYFIKVIVGNESFFRILGKSKISDLDLSAGDHEFDWDLRLRGGNTYADIYKYPLINYGRFNTSRTVDLRYLRPAIFSRAILDQIEAESGYTFSGEILNSFEITRQILPFTNERLEGDPEYTKAKGITNVDFVVPDGLFPFKKMEIHDSNVLIDPNNLITYGSGAGYGYYKAQYSGTYYARFILDYENLSGSSGVVDVWIKRGGSTIIMDQYDLDYDNWLLGITTGVRTYEGKYVLEKDDELYLLLRNTGIGFINIHSGSSLEIYDAEDLEAFYGSRISLSYNLPDFTQIDFMKAVAQMTGIIFATDALNKIVYFKQFKNLYENSHLAKDWSGKVVISKAKRSSIIPGYAQRNHFKYKVDSSEYERFIPGDADGFFDVDDQNLPEEKTIATLPFAGTFESREYLAGSGSGIPVPSILMQKPISIPDDPAFQVKVLPRVLYDLFIDADDLDGDPFTLTDGTNSLAFPAGMYIPFCYFVTPHSFPVPGSPALKYLDWDSMLQDHYTELQRMLFRAKLLKVPAYISAVDVETRDHFIPIYLKQEAANFYLNKIDRNVNDGRLTEIILIRM